MNKYYVLNNSLDNTLYHKSADTDTRLVNESKRFLTRKSAEKYSRVKGLNESYQVKLINESVSKDSLELEEIESSLEDIKDMIDTTVDLIEYYNDNNELEEDASDGYDKVPLEDILEKLKKMKSYMAGLAFSPYFDNSLGHCSITPDEPNTPSSTEAGSDSSE